MARKRKALSEDRREILQTILLNARHEAVHEIRDRLSRMRNTDGETRRTHAGANDLGDASQLDAESDLQVTLVQVSSERLNAIDAALGRLDRGVYGVCTECGDEISEKRLRALPFAVRCRDCEEAREDEQNRERRRVLGRSGSFVSPSE